MESVEHEGTQEPVPYEPESYRFGELEIDLSACELRRNGREILLSAKSMQVLVYLIRNRGRLVSRRELLDALWPDTRVATGSLTQAVWEARRALSEQPNGDRMIKTLRRKGYRFDAGVTPCVRSGKLESAGDAYASWPQPLQERLRRLSTDTQTIVLELAMFLARHAAAEREG